MENKITNKKFFKKPAITLAEIMIVVAIVAIITLIFLAMPKKNVGKMDRAKYYVAYNTLKRMQDEQMAQVGRAAIDFNCQPDGEGGYTCPNCTDATCTSTYVSSGDITTNESFGRAVNIWLNTMNPNDTESPIDLSNGMRITWGAPYSCGAGDAECLNVTVDIDGSQNGTNSNGQDIHTFTLDSHGNVIPSDGSGEWIRFKIYHIQDNGTTFVDDTNKGFNEIYKKYVCWSFSPDNRFYYKDDNGVSQEVNDGYCTSEAVENYSTKHDGTTYFMEAIPPLK